MSDYNEEFTNKINNLDASLNNKHSNAANYRSLQMQQKNSEIALRSEQKGARINQNLDQAHQNLMNRLNTVDQSLMTKEQRMQNFASMKNHEAAMRGMNAQQRQQYLENAYNKAVANENELKAKSDNNLARKFTMSTAQKNAN